MSDERKDKTDQEARMTHFGAETVAFDEKPGKVRDVFENVAARYDLMNDVMSARVHRLWKDALVDWLAPRRGGRHLDLAGGTGDIAMRILGRVGGDMRMTVCDFTEGMLREGMRRAVERGVQAPVDWICGDAMALPFADKSFDSATIAFGIRNVADPAQALREIHRVLKTGGRFICLEFSRVRNPLLAAAYDVYSDRVIPQMGKLVAKDEASYRYLVESIRRFPDQERFEEMMREAGFKRVAHRNLSAGVAALHSGWRY